MKKKDIINIIILIATLSLLIFLITPSDYFFASTLDFEAQHYIFIEYFRNLFYETNNLFPDFMFNLGSGQNIYNIAYYGLLNPIYMLSYFFKNMEIIHFVMITMYISILTSAILLYFLIRKKHSAYVSLLTSFIFICATPLIFHMKRHIMFVNYMPFLILGFYGIDSKIEKNKSLLLIISIVLIILTSYFFSVGSLICLFIYGLYKTNKFDDIRDFINKSIKLSIPFLIAIGISACLLLPTAYALVTGREESNTTINIIELLKPNNFFLYEHYGLGLSLMSLVLIIYAIIKFKLKDKLLGIFILLIGFIPLFNFILNGFMYINGKSLIPFIPLIMILIAKSLTDILKKDKLYIKIIIGLYTITSTFLITLNVNEIDNLIEKQDYNNYTEEYLKAIEFLEEYDQTYYKINNQLGLETLNKVSPYLEYKTSLYSSTSNLGYQDFYFNRLQSNVQYRNQFVTNSSSNYISQAIMSEKYIITKYELDNPYKFITKIDDIFIYENIHATSLGYATNQTISKKDYNNKYQLYNTLLSDTTTNLIETKEVDYNFNIIEQNNIEIIKNNEFTKIKASNDAYLKVNINTQVNTLNTLSFDLENTTSDLEITINNTSNLLTTSTWKYYNNNETFYFDFTSNELYIKFKKGEYNISNIKVNSIDLNNLNKEVDIFITDMEKTKGDFIEGNINVLENSTFILNIPYEKNFIIKVDGKQIDYEEVNEGLIGFDIEKGNHNIKIEYKAPLKDISLLISGFSIIIMLCYIKKR